MTANSSISISPTQKPGTEMPSVMPNIAGRAHQRSRCGASTRPSGTAKTTASSSDSAVSSSVTGSAAASKRGDRLVAEDGLAEVPLRGLLQPEAVADRQRAIEAELVLDRRRAARASRRSRASPPPGCRGPAAIVKKQSDADHEQRARAPRSSCRLRTAPPGHRSRYRMRSVRVPAACGPTTPSPAAARAGLRTRQGVDVRAGHSR